MRDLRLQSQRVLAAYILPETLRGLITPDETDGPVELLHYEQKRLRAAYELLCLGVDVDDVFIGLDLPVLEIGRKRYFGSGVAWIAKDAGGRYAAWRPAPYDGSGCLWTPGDLLEVLREQDEEGLQVQLWLRGLDPAERLQHEFHVRTGERPERRRARVPPAKAQAPPRKIDFAP